MCQNLSFISLRPANLLKKRLKWREIFWSTFFTEHLRATDSVTTYVYILTSAIIKWSHTKLYTNFANGLVFHLSGIKHEKFRKTDLAEAEKPIELACLFACFACIHLFFYKQLVSTLKLLIFSRFFGLKVA